MPSSAAISACQGSVAHFTRDEYSCTPDRGANAPIAPSNPGAHSGQTPVRAIVRAYETDEPARMDGEAMARLAARKGR